MVVNKGYERNEVAVKNKDWQLKKVKKRPRSKYCSSNLEPVPIKIVKKIDALRGKDRPQALKQSGTILSSISMSLENKTLFRFNI